MILRQSQRTWPSNDPFTSHYARHDPHFTNEPRGRPDRTTFSAREPEHIMGASAFNQFESSRGNDYDFTNQAYYPSAPSYGPQIINHAPASSDSHRRYSQESHYQDRDSPSRHSYTDIEYEQSTSTSLAAAAGTTSQSRSIPRYHARRKPFNQDEFDGPTQLLPPPSPRSLAGRERPLLALPVNLTPTEQDDILHRLNDVLATCAFHFIAKYNFPIPLDRDKPPVSSPSDRDWTEWAYLLKRLATKRRIPARFLYGGQIKQFVTTVENAVAARPPAAAGGGSAASMTDVVVGGGGQGGQAHLHQHQHQRHDSRAASTAQTHPHPLHPAQTQTPTQQNVNVRDDRSVLQLVSAGIQVAKILRDALALEQLDNLYVRAEGIVLGRRGRGL